jgi:hypothetical protein
MHDFHGFRLQLVRPNGSSCKFYAIDVARFHILTGTKSGFSVWLKQVFSPESTTTFHAGTRDQSLEFVLLFSSQLPLSLAHLVAFLPLQLRR